MMHGGWGRMGEGLITGAAKENLCPPCCTSSSSLGKYILLATSLGEYIPPRHVAFKLVFVLILGKISSLFSRQDLSQLVIKCA